MRILGVDPGLRLTGYGCVELRPGMRDPAVVEAGVLRLTRGSMGMRLAQLHRDLAEILAELAPAHVVVEQLFTHTRFARTSILMGHARGVVLLAAQQHGAEIGELTATEVKKAVAGRGHASKAQMQRAVMSQCRLSKLPSPPDVADALAIAVCAARRMPADAVATIPACSSTDTSTSPTSPRAGAT